VVHHQTTQQQAPAHFGPGQSQKLASSSATPTGPKLILHHILLCSILLLLIDRHFWHDSTKTSTRKPALFVPSFLSPAHAGKLLKQRAGDAIISYFI
jgi:hypothetical protein